tara:strand:+ start:123 stop:395 length:273 start_codon:yes stop_codon:yes gene_type:complete
MVRKMGASNWYLFFGAVFCCTGVGLPVGIFMIIYWFYKDFMDKGVTVNHVQANREEPGQEDQTFSGNLGTDNDYKFKGNIGDLRNREQYT